MSRNDTYDPPDHEISFALDEDRPLSHEEWQAYGRAQRDERRREKRDQQRREDEVRFKLADAARVALIKAGRDPRQPPEYRGQTWEHATPLGIAHLATPPMRDDPQSPPIEAFVDFQMYNGQRMRTEHPDWYCADCGIRYAPPPICTHCGSARQDRLEKPLVSGETHRCRACHKPYRAKPPICGPCIEARHPDLLALATAARGAAASRKKPPKKGAGMADGVYPL